MLNPKAFANAFTVVGLGVYIVCRVLSLMAPDFLFGIGRSWFHTFNMDAIRGTTPMDLGTFLYGGITLAILVWITAYSGASLYNKWK